MSKLSKANVWGDRYRIEHKDNDEDSADDLDHYVFQDGMAEPVGMFRTKEAAELFKRDRIEWEGKGCPPESRPASNHPRYQ